MKERDSAVIGAVKKACQIISCFSNEDHTLGVGDIADRLGMHVSTTHHLVSTLCSEGVLMKDKRNMYRLGWKLLEWNNHVMFQQDVYEKAMPLGSIGMVMSKNGRVEQTGSSAAVLGQPATAIAWAVNQLAIQGKGLKKGDIILSGAMSEAIAFESGDSIVAEFDGLGSVSMFC
jgi:hypothetical protein